MYVDRILDFTFYLEHFIDAFDHQTSHQVACQSLMINAHTRHFPLKVLCKTMHILINKLLLINSITLANLVSKNGVAFVLACISLIMSKVVHSSYIYWPVNLLIFFAHFHWFEKDPWNCKKLHCKYDFSIFQFCYL